MLNPVSKSYSAATVPGPQTPICLDYIPAGDATVALWVDPAATLVAVVEVTLDDVNEVDPSMVRWFPLANAPTSATGYTAFQNPWVWIRLNITIITGNVEFKVAQSINTNRAM